MAEGAVPRLTRLLGIVTHLEEHGEATFEDLARHFGVTGEQIRNDIDTLWVSGLPGYGTTDLLDFDGFAYDQGVARLTESLGLRQVRLAPSEAVALMGALASIIASGVAPAAAAGTLDALRTAVTGAAALTVVVSQVVDADMVEVIRAGIAGERAVAMTYVDAQDRRTERVIEPHRLVAVDGVGYVECFCRRADAPRTLRLDRIEHAEPTDSPSTMTRGTSDGFALESMFDALVEVNRAGRWAFEDLPGVALSEDGAVVTASFGVANVSVVVSRLLAVAPHLVSVEPQQLRGPLADAADAILAAAANADR